MANNTLKGKTALVTGSARRLGEAMVRRLHAEGADVVVHFRSSEEDARTLKADLENVRPDSIALVQADLLDIASLERLVAQAAARWGSLDILVNNASSFYPTGIGDTSEADWNDLLGSNLKAPFFLAQAATPSLMKSGGCIVNMVDIHAAKPLAGHPVYCAAKAGLAMLTRSLAVELAPGIRVNGIAPGAILWPESGLETGAQQNILDDIPLGRTGTPDDIVDTLMYLVNATYVSGQIIAVDGGRSQR